MKYFLVFALSLLAVGAVFGQKNKGNGKGNSGANSGAQPQKRWGIAWEAPKGWTRAGAGAEAVKFAHPKDEDVYVLVQAFALPAEATEKERIIGEFANKEGDVADYAEFAKMAKTATLGGMQVKVYEDDEEPDLEEAEEPEDYEGYWTKIVVIEQGDKLILVSLSEIYMRKRKHEKTFDEIYRSFKKA